MAGKSAAAADCPCASPRFQDKPNLGSYVSPACASLSSFSSLSHAVPAAECTKNTDAGIDPPSLNVLKPRAAPSAAQTSLLPRFSCLSVRPPAENLNLPPYIDCKFSNFAEVCRRAGGRVFFCGEWHSQRLGGLESTPDFGDRGGWRRPRGYFFRSAHIPQFIRERSRSGKRIQFEVDTRLDIQHSGKRKRDPGYFCQCSGKLHHLLLQCSGHG